jgi:hypothetical protein
MMDLLSNRETMREFLSNRTMESHVRRGDESNSWVMIRILPDLDYKDLKNFLPSFEFVSNRILSSATKRTPFESAHGLPARTIAQARIEVQRVGRGATDPEILEDVSPGFDGSAVKHNLDKLRKLRKRSKPLLSGTAG